MGEVLPLPNPGDVFDDVRGDDRTLRVHYHADHGIVVISLWAGRVCRGSFRLDAADAPRLAALFADVTAPTAAPLAGPETGDAGPETRTG